ncbi:MAG: hypothetical protein H6907_21745 [Hyphomicrobiales bacterium]|nr:hypothetical protein [Hyphomicrobiales bacterium]
MKKEQADRRDFLKAAGKTAVTAPAVALLVAAGGKNASAFFGTFDPDTVSGGNNQNVTSDNIG